MPHYTVAELSAGLATKKYSSVELTKMYLDRIKRLDIDINSFITVTEEIALIQAQQADHRRSQGDLSPLLGIPVAHKDIFCTLGAKTTCASRMLDNFISPYNATLVERLEDAGVILLGKTNMDEFAMGSSNETSFYGPVKNPWDLSRVPGGSSGGSAAAVAAGFAPATTGSDTGGSVRQPAALCGITGLKPTYGRVSRFGMIAYASSLDQAGIMATTAEDCAFILNVMAGEDKKDSTSSDHPVPNYTETLDHPLTGLRVGLPKEYFNHNLNPDMDETIQEVIKELQKLGATFYDISLSSTSFSVPVYYVIAPAECSSNLARYDGIRYGYRCQAPQDLLDLYERTRSEGFGEEVKRRIMIGTYVLSAGYYDAFYLKAEKIRHLISEDFQQAFQQIDVILAPSTPTPAFKLGEKNTDPVEMYLSDIYTIPVNLAGLPGISIPAGFINGLPVGVQLIGPRFAEAKLLNVAHQLQQQTDWHKQVPVGYDKSE